MAHETVAGVTQRRSDVRGVDPAFDALPGRVLMQPPRDRSEGHPCASEDVAHLGYRTLTAVGQPRSRVEGGVIHPLRGLQVDDQHGGVRALRDGEHHRTRQIRGEEEHDEVAVRLAKSLRSGRALLCVGDEADVGYVGVHPREPLGDVPRGLLQLRKKGGELRPVGAETARDQTDARLSPSARGKEGGQ